jgi:hypothetical protein
MSGIEIYQNASERTSCSLDSLAQYIERQRARRELAFSKGRMELVAELANCLMKQKPFKQIPALHAFGFWARKGSIATMLDDFQARLPKRAIAVGRGIAFHLPPMNVETIFLYSWVVAFLTGNVNVVRLPTTISETITSVLDALLGLLKQADFADTFISYAASPDINSRLSRLADIRLLWGGDEKAQAFENMPLRIDGKGIVFPERYSYCVLGGNWLLRLSEVEYDAVARGLYNDIFMFNQMACSSPHIIHVVGCPDNHAIAVDRLMRALDGIAKSQRTIVDTADAITKFTAATRLASEGLIDRAWRYSNETTAVRMLKSTSCSVGHGFLCISYIEELDDLVGFANERHQTLTHQGFSRETIDAFARKTATRGLYRLVPVGQALNFDVVWDGHDLLMETARFVRVV